MEPDELKAAWQALDRRLAQHQHIQLALFKETKLEKARRHLRPLFWGQLLQLLLGIGLILLGIACWSRNTGATGLFATGVIVHAFGVLTAVAAAITMVLAGSIDYAAPVLRIQKRMALLLRFYAFNANVCGLPWWIMWVLVVVAFAGLGTVDPNAVTPTWIWISLVVGVAGLLVTWFFLRVRQAPAAKGAPRGDACAGDGADGIRRSQRLLDEIAEFERE